MATLNDETFLRRDKRLVLCTRIFLGLFSSLWLVLGINSLHAHWGLPNLSEGIIFVVFGLPFLAVALFGTQSILIFFLWVMGLLIVLGTVNKGMAAGAEGVGQAIVVVVGIGFVLLALMLGRNKRRIEKLKGQSSVSQPDGQPQIATEMTRFPELCNLSQEALEVIVSSGKDKYAESYIQAASALLSQRKSESAPPTITTSVSEVVQEKSHKRSLPLLSDIDGRLLKLVVIFLIGVRAFEIVVNHLMDPSALGRSYMGLLAGVFFSFNLLERKSWARSWIIALAVFALLINPARLYLDKNLFGAIDAALVPIVLLALVCLRTTFKKGLVYVGAYVCWVVILFGFVGYGSYGRNAERKIIEAINSPRSIRSDKNYDLSLGALNWKIVPRTEMVKVSPELSPNVDITLARADAAAFGALTPESIEKIEINDNSLTKIGEYINKTHFASPIFKNERRLPRGILVSGKINTAGQEIAVVSFWNAYDTMAINGYFWGTSDQLPDLVRDVNTLLLNISEVSLKERLPKLTASEVFSRNSDAVVLLRLYDDKGQIVAFGSGFNVRKDGLIATNFHVVLGGGIYLDVKFPKHGVYENVGIVGVGAEGVDLALLKISGKDLPVIENFRGVEVEVGDPVYVISNPEGLVNSLSEGLISAIRPEGKSYLYQFTAPISSGSSGGAVFNQFGQVIGLATSVLKNGQNLNFAVPIDEVAKAKLFKEYISLKDLVLYLNTADKNKESDGK